MGPHDMLNHATQKIKKMHARRNPNLQVSSASYSQLSPSITSATFLSPTVASRRGLLSPSPPPSPSLPSLIPRHGGKKQSPSSHTRLVKRLLIGCCGVAILLWLIIRQIYAQQQFQQTDYEEEEGDWEMVGGSLLPEEPSAVVVQDTKGKSKWTVSIPSNFDFPLKPAQYREICHGSMELSKQLRQEAHANSGIARRMLGYYQTDQYFIDVPDAEAQALLPPSKQTGRPKNFVDDVAIANKEYTGGMKVCDSTLTYVMETEDAGFGNTLLRMWMSYGLAQAENRTFFVDDTRWPYGKFSTYFMPPPSAGCLPPPKSHMVPCPHNARHIVVSGATITSTFGHQFTDEWEDPTKQYVQRQHKIFGLVRVGYEALFKLRPDDGTYVLDRALSLYGPIAKNGGISIGIHVRRGDKHPYEFQYQKDYIPLDRYMDTARDLYIDRIENANGKSKKHRSLEENNLADNLFARHTSSKLVLASDDPIVYESGELGPNSVRAQDRIMLATKAALEAAHGKKNPWIDEITGWEGGFYKDVFFSLGRPVGNANDMNKLNNENVPEEAMKLRELVGRAYLMDLAVLGKADTVVCTVSSIGCRVLAVMMGWDSAITQKNWVNVDGDFDWKGIVW
ncbi:hypothetical protein K458DRAFT_47766 [Lentithecium fluviatile CBS 122367]|uniref:Glycosyltransferase family 23 protein n=1 Tax=Lentithecium fluviatile CBS 122367 TaxID=1168545 RepID=A0A6G1J006_9PLEO|nr:hypothetical protein K458DRAFT_47766 [Lentithecium fluviatile CBS 122367]